MRFLTQYPGIPEWAKRILNDWAQILNGQISFGDGTSKNNIDGVWISATTPNPAGTNFVVNHGLLRTPVAFLLVDKNAQVDVWRSAASTQSQMTFAASAANVNIKLFIF